MTDASVPPASTMSDSPYWMYLSASPMACVPVAHALTTPKLGPLAPSWIATIEPAVLPMIEGSRKGEMRFAPLVVSTLHSGREGS